MAFPAPLSAITLTSSVPASFPLSHATTKDLTPIELQEAFQQIASGKRPLPPASPHGPSNSASKDAGPSSPSATKAVAGTSKLDQAVAIFNAAMAADAANGPNAAPQKPNDSAMLINLSGLQIGTAHCITLAHMMILNKTVLVLDLSACDMHDDGCVELFKSLKRNSTLKELALAGNHLTAKSAVGFAEYLLTNASLESASFAQNSIGDEGVLAIAPVLRHNATLKFLNLRGNLITDKGAQALLEVLTKEDDALLKTRKEAKEAADAKLNASRDPIMRELCKEDNSGPEVYSNNRKINALWLNMNVISPALLSEFVALFAKRYVPPVDLSKKGKKGKKGAKKK